MKFFKTLTLVSALALLGLGSVDAAAAVESGATYLVPDLSGDTLVKEFYFDDSELFDDNTGDVQTHTAGDSFDDYFYFTLPDSSYLSFTALDDFATGAGIQFTGFELLAAGYGDVPQFTVGAVNGFFATGGGVGLDEGTYVLELTGTFTLSGSAYEGVIVATPVPEPAGWALLLAGLGAVAGAARRRGGRA